MIDITTRRGEENQRQGGKKEKKRKLGENITFGSTKS